MTPSVLLLVLLGYPLEREHVAQDLANPCMRYRDRRPGAALDQDRLGSRRREYALALAIGHDVVASLPQIIRQG